MKKYECLKERINVRTDKPIFIEGKTYSSIGDIVIGEDGLAYGDWYWEEHLKEVTHLSEPGDKFVVSVFIFGALFGASITLIITYLIN